nr:dual specificity protein phosphatase 22 isoform X4 [Equus asinus]
MAYPEGLGTLLPHTQSELEVCHGSGIRSFAANSRLWVSLEPGALMAQSLPSCLQRLALGLGFSRSHPPSAHTPPSQCSLLTARTPQGFLLHSPAMRTLSGLTLRFQVTAGVLSYLLMPSQCLGVELNAPGHFISLHGEHLSLGELAVAPLAMFWTRHFKESIKFIHECRLRGEGCLVHCLAGVSRSVTLVIAYIMTVTDFGWEDALHTVRAGRSCANPNLGFQRQLQDFEKHEVHQYRQWLKEEYGESPLRDAEEARNILGMFFLHSHPGNSEAPGLSQTTVICLKFLKCCKATELRLVLPKRNST